MAARSQELGAAADAATKTLPSESHATNAV